MNGEETKPAPNEAYLRIGPEYYSDLINMDNNISSLFWRAQIGGWMFIALSGFTMRVILFSDIQLAIILTVTTDSVGFMLTATAHKFFLSRAARAPVVIFLMCFCPLAGYLEMEIARLVRSFFSSDIFTFVGGASQFVYYTGALAGWALAYLWLRADIEARSERIWRSEAQANATRAELEQLRLQLAPHFLFNALNSVASEIHDRPDAALEMVRRIASYLRYCLDQKTHSICSLTDELEAMHSYMRIQELRFEGKLRCKVTVDSSARDIMVPHMILQGLTENAVKHGLQHSSDSIEIAVTAQRRDFETVVIEVANSGALKPPAGGRPAIGLSNTRRRLELHYPDGYDLSLRQVSDTVVARIVLKGSACFV